jgi:hypothetical protein
MLAGLSNELRYSGPSARAATAREFGPGIVCSVLLHVLFGLLIFFLIVRTAAQPPQPLVRFLPIDLVQLAAQATSPPQPRKAQMPRQQASRAAREVPTSPHPPVALSPSRKLPPPDTLEIRLKALARLRQPETVLPSLDNAGASDAAATSDSASPGVQAAYRVRDFIRAQVLRRWGLDLKQARNIVILIHVVVARDGSVNSAEIVDRSRYASDSAWRAVALSVRNAVILSSPLTLPPGQAGPIDVTLALNPRDALR